MPLYPVSVRRCQHIKVNGTQCGSPALRNDKHCHFHQLWAEKQLDVNKSFPERMAIILPTLEDANSIQVALAEVMRLLIHGLLDHRTVALLLHALRTAVINLKYTSLEPELPTRVVIDPESVEQRPLGATAWSRVEGREYDELENNDPPKKDSKKHGLKKEMDPEEAERSRQFGEHFQYLVDGLARDPNFLDRRTTDAEAGQEKNAARSAP
ncbi:MAG: hypothetical protein WCF68_10185 [Terriglobales bacterium]